MDLHNFNYQSTRTSSDDEKSRLVMRGHHTKKGLRRYGHNPLFLMVGFKPTPPYGSEADFSLITQFFEMEFCCFA